MPEIEEILGSATLVIRELFLELSASNGTFDLLESWLSFVRVWKEGTKGMKSFSNPKSSSVLDYGFLD